jgi:hypothetical protein
MRFTTAVGTIRASVFSPIFVAPAFPPPAIRSSG